MTGHAEPQWMAGAAAAVVADLYESGDELFAWDDLGENRREEYLDVIRAALPAIRSGLADEIAATRDRMLLEADNRMVWPTRLGEVMDGLTYAEKIVRGQS